MLFFRKYFKKIIGDDPEKLIIFLSVNFEPEFKLERLANTSGIKNLLMNQVYMYLKKLNLMVFFFIARLKMANSIGETAWLIQEHPMIALEL